MKKLIIIAALAASFCGCQTRITAEKNAEVAHPIKSVVKVNGTNQVLTTGYMVTSGGWYATARSPLWATEELRGLSIGVNTNGTVSLALDAYSRDLSTNAVTMAHNLVSDFAVLAEKAAAAYATCGATVVSAKAQSAVQKAIASYITKGGSAQKAQVTCENGTCTFTDGVVTEVCADGSCSPQL